MIFRRWFVRMAQHCFVCRKPIWFYQRWYSTYDNFLFHFNCAVRCHCLQCKTLIRTIREQESRIK